MQQTNNAATIQRAIDVFIRARWTARQRLQNSDPMLGADYLLKDSMAISIHDIIAIKKN